MATENFSDAPVELANAMDAGFKDAMDRIHALALDPTSTLVDQIPLDIWASWDATDECANVLDSDGVDGFEDDGDVAPVAA